MTLIVADTSPLNYLIQLGCVEILPQLFSAVLIPTEVLAELRHPRAPEPVRRWAQLPPPWLEVRPVTRPLTLAADAGEVSALSLAVELHLSEVLMDDGRGRELARELGLRPLGTLRLLELAAGHALIDLHLTLDALEATNYRIHPRLIQRLRQGHRPPRG